MACLDRDGHVTDKAANNVIVVCKKYYLEVVTKEITATTTYDPVARDKADIISDHLRYMSNNHITVKPELQCLPSLTLGAHAQRGLLYLVRLSVCLSVSVSTTILALQATKGHQSDTNSSSATSDPKLKRRFC